MFNREYQSRTARQALRNVGAELQRDAESWFYRPVERHRHGADSGDDGQPRRRRRRPLLLGQMSFNFERDTEQPLADLFPEAYDTRRHE